MDSNSVLMCVRLLGMQLLGSLGGLNAAQQQCIYCSSLGQNFYIGRCSVNRKPFAYGGFAKRFSEHQRALAHHSAGTISSSSTMG